MAEARPPPLEFATSSGDHRKYLWPSIFVNALEFTQQPMLVRCRVFWYKRIWPFCITLPLFRRRSLFDAICANRSNLSYKRPHEGPKTVAHLFKDWFGNVFRPVGVQHATLRMYDCVGVGVVMVNRRHFDWPKTIHHR